MRGESTIRDVDEETVLIENLKSIYFLNKKQLCIIGHVNFNIENFSDSPYILKSRYSPTDQALYILNSEEHAAIYHLSDTFSITN